MKGRLNANDAAPLISLSTRLISLFSSLNTFSTCDSNAEGGIGVTDKVRELVARLSAALTCSAASVLPDETVTALMVELPDVVIAAICDAGVDCSALVVSGPPLVLNCAETLATMSAEPLATVCELPSTAAEPLRLVFLSSLSDET